MHLKSTKDAAVHISKSVSWLNKSRMTGTGPVYLKIGGAVRYRDEDLNTWLVGKRRTGVYEHCNDNVRASA